MKYLARVGVLFVAAALCACGSTPSLPGDDRAAGAVPMDLTERYVHQIVGSLQDSFVSRDVRGFMKHVSDGFYKGYARLEEELQREFREGGAPFLEVTVTDVADDELRVNATVTWSRSAAAGAAAESGGETLLVFHKVDTLSLVDVRHGSLFGIGDL